MSDQNISVSDQEWHLEGYANEGRIWVIKLTPLPFVIGRQEDCHLRLIFAEVSRRHAEIYEQQNQLWIRDAGSVNGTFVNRQRINSPRLLKSGDILHFGSQEFRISYRENSVLPDNPDAENTQSVPILSLPQGFVDCEAEFNQMLCEGAIVPHYQPIVQLPDQQVIGYELLGRSHFPGLPNGAWPLLQIARSLGKEIELSALFRRAGVQQVAGLNNRFRLFFNMLPIEMNGRFLERLLRDLRALAPTLNLAMEIHEAAITQVDLMRNLRALLTELDIDLVYDDFGAGQARLVELITVPPNYLKFDIALIHNIHAQPPKVQQMLQTLVRMARDLGIKTLAEGTELAEEVETCKHLGFELAQGFYFGKPEPRLRAARP